MASFLLTWEFGSGLGHMALLEPVARGLVERGHRVVLALKNFASANRIFSVLQVELLPTPASSGSIPNRHDPISTFPQLLHNVGFGNQEDLQTLASAWQTIYRLVQPNVLVCNFSPIAMVAARRLPLKIVTLGTGFESPAVCHPYPDWRPELKNDPNELLKHEQFVMDSANAVLDALGHRRLNQLSDLYRDVDETILLTYPEIDPFGERNGTDYFGTWPDPRGKQPAWPKEGNMRAFVYLRPLKGIENVLELLSNSGLSVILRIPGATESLRKKFKGSNLHWEDDFIDLQATLQQCDFGICHASHTMSAAMLHAGKPIFMLPPFLEQGLTAMKIAKRKAGIISTMEDPQHLRDSLERLMQESIYYESAQEFAKKYPTERRRERVVEAVERIESLSKDP